MDTFDWVSIQPSQPKQAILQIGFDLNLFFSRRSFTVSACPCPFLNQGTTHFINPTTHLVFFKISLSPSTSVFPRYLLIKNLSSKQQPLIKVSLTFPGTITRFSFHHNQHVRHIPERIVPASSFGIIPRSAET